MPHTRNHTQKVTVTINARMLVQAVAVHASVVTCEWVCRHLNLSSAALGIPQLATYSGTKHMCEVSRALSHPHDWREREREREKEKKLTLCVVLSIILPMQRFKPRTATLFYCIHPGGDNIKLVNVSINKNSYLWQFTEIQLQVTKALCSIYNKQFIIL